MPNEEVLGPRKTMFVLVIVVGCFAVLWPKILSPLILGGTREQLKPNAYDREAALKQERPPIRVGAASHPALRERGRAIPAAGPPPRTPTPLPPHHRVPYQNPLSGYFEIDIKPPPIPGMRPPLGSPGGPVPAPKSSMGFVMPIYTICIIVFFVYTLSKLIFKRSSTVPYDSIAPDPQFRRRVFRDDSRSTPDRLVVTAISGLVAEVQQQMEASYAQNQQTQDVQDNHARPYTNGTVIHSGPVQIVASEYQEPSKEKSPEIQKEIPEPREASPEPYPGSETVEKEISPEKEILKPNEASPEPSPEPETVEKEISPEKEILKPKEASPEPSPEPENVEKDISPEKMLAPKELTPKEEQTTPETDTALDEKEFKPQEITPNTKMTLEKEEDNGDEEIEDNLEEEIEEVEEEEKDPTEELIKLTQKIEQKTDTLAKLTGEFLEEEKGKLKILSTPELERKTSDLLEEALIESSPEKESEVVDQDNGSVKVVGMEVTAHSADGGQWPRAAPPPLTPLPPPRPPHEAEEVKSIFLETEIPQQSRVLVADFAQANKQKTQKHSPMVVSGKMTLSLIQDAPRETPELDPESTLDDFTTASGFTQPAEKEDDLSEEEEEMEIEEIEEIEEEVEEEEVEEEAEQKK